MATRVTLTLVLKDGTRWDLPRGTKVGTKTTFKIPTNTGTIVPVVSIEAKTTNV